MSLSVQAQNRAKFERLLALSGAQITALEIDDMPVFDRISVEKRKVIASLADARAMIDADPSLEALAAQINASENKAQRILAAKIGQIRSEMNDLNQRTKVRAAYASTALLPPRKRMMSTPGAPRFMDQKQ
ncbi:hypothetical protein CCAX7_31820 [Capsulimonas corticalis]|uniref:Uncharacterized protein n=1 Tax=Capsulimonas corticalis TaxID=2219043 RepID=A0A402CSC5_9BACT|nr:hypothetical protein [Capsulimonas corticalis]BDI31131.1 hypothetical protein CCAX7_31820 [Capsulimonas corticalis]